MIPSEYLKFLSKFSESKNQNFSFSKCITSGSGRENYLITSEHEKKFLTINEDVRENESFFYFTQIFSSLGIRVPTVESISENRKAYIQSYLGENTLLSILQKLTDSEKESLLYKVLDFLIQIQEKTKPLEPPKLYFDFQKYNEDAVLQDCFYFKSFALDIQNATYQKQNLISEFRKLAMKISGIQSQCWMLRDFQSRNILIDDSDGRIGVIDYQACMQGPKLYDVVSLLFQHRLNLTLKEKDSLLHYYFSRQTESEISQMHSDLPYIRLVRLLQVTGAYGLRGVLQKKQEFINSFEGSIIELIQFFENDSHYTTPEMMQHYFPEIYASCLQLKNKTMSLPQKDKSLHIKIYSFSFKKKGIPEDKTGNGGGFVFDCRGILNPGRIEEYKSQTGADESVKEYLETKTKMPDFLRAVQDIVKISIDDYLARNFENLQISFGCTGGQHRSVYAANAVYNWLQQTYPETQCSIWHEEQAHLNTGI